MIRPCKILPILALLTISVSSAALVNVPADYQTIQEALDSRSVYDGDTILVHPGIYLENIQFRGRSIVVASLFLVTGDRSYIGSTVIDGTSSGSVVTFAEDGESVAALIGLTIQNGLAESGGGIHCTNSSPAIRHNIIKNNRAGREGGGIFFLQSAPEITDNRITGNQAVQGGGIFCRDSSVGTGENDHLPGHSRFNIKPVIRFDHNVLAGNSAQQGGGIYCRNLRLKSRNNTITENSAESGGGLYCLDSEFRIVSSIIWSNSAVNGPQIFGDPSVVSYSDVERGWPGDGNIDLDPLFRRPEYGDYKLMSIACGDDSNSPCIDTGSPVFTDAFLDCSWGRGTVFCDMGAFGGKGAEHSSENLLRVPFDFDTPQEGVNAALDGDTVLVYPGVYAGHVNFGGKEITMASLYLVNPSAQLIRSTIIDGESAGSVVIFENGESHSAVLTGLTLRNGRAVNGAGIFCYYSDPAIIRNVLETNTALSDGGGIFCFYSNPYIEGNTVSSNQAVSGAGIVCRFSSPVIRGNIFWGNQAQREGGAILCRDNSFPAIEGNEITGNSADQGGGILCRYTDPTISGNLIYSNSASGGGGIYCVGSAPSIINNLVVRNSSSRGGGLLCLNSTPVILNCILYYNEAAEGSQVFGGQPTITYSDIEGGWEGSGNIDDDPLFRNLDGGDLHLQSSVCGDQTDSPCIDAGDPGVSDSLLACEWGLGSSTSDMGAYGGGNIPTEIRYTEKAPEDEFGILGNYPNPFNSSTAIRFRTRDTGISEVEIFDIRGRLVDIIPAKYRRDGVNVAIWDASGIAAGVYFARLKNDSPGRSARIVLLK